MYGDPQHLRVLAHRLEEEGLRVDAGATRLRRGAAGVRWESTAAGLMRRRAEDQVRSMQEVARRYAAAASAVRDHAAAVEQQLDRIRQVEDQVRQLGARLEHLAGTPAAAVGLARLGALALPPTGHRDWLEVPARLAHLGIAL